jgi:ABC-type multidrug transport system fused ATPase/permease subunit
MATDLREADRRLADGRGTSALPSSLYAYVWKTSMAGQIRICLMTAIVAPLAMAPLELQRRIVEDAVGSRDMRMLALFVAAYLVVVLVQNGIKYAVNLTKGRVLEDVARDIRYRVLASSLAASGSSSAIDGGTTVSILAAESEDVGGFASESFSVPLLQAGTIFAVAGYLLWVEPLIAIFAIVIYLPQAIVVPRVQHAINRLARTKTWLVRKLGRNVSDANSRRAVFPDEWRVRAANLIDNVLATRMKIYVRKFALTFLGNVLDGLGPIAVLGIGGYLVTRGETEIGTLIVFISGFQKMSGPWDELINFYRTASNAGIAYRLIVEALAHGAGDNNPRSVEPPAGSVI